jgi:hypothetical protein
MTQSNDATLSATCDQHGTPGFTNLRVRLVPGGVQLDPHVTGSCVITLAIVEAEMLLALLNRWL